MGRVSYDNTEVPDLDPEMLDFAADNNLVVVHVACESAEEGVDINFFCMFGAMPQIGSRLQLEDNKQCEVIDVIHAVWTIQDTNHLQAMPHVRCKLVGT